jgi:hypothetical protein
MDKEEMIKYLKRNLEVKVFTEHQWIDAGENRERVIESVQVELWLDGDRISTAYAD